MKAVLLLYLVVFVHFIDLACAGGIQQKFTSLEEKACNAIVLPRGHSWEFRHKGTLLITRDPETDSAFLLIRDRFFGVVARDEGSGAIYLGQLAGNVRFLEAVQARIIAWKDYFLLAVVLPKHVEIYQIRKEEVLSADLILSTHTSSDHQFELIQSLSIPGIFKAIFLPKPTCGNRVVLIISVLDLKNRGKYVIYEWLGSYFNPADEILVPGLYVNKLIDGCPKYLVTGRLRRSRKKVVITIFELIEGTLELKKKRVLSVDPYGVQAMLHQNRTFVIGCKTRHDECTLHALVGDHFLSARTGPHENLLFSKFHSDGTILAAVGNRSILLYADNNLDCPRKFTTDDDRISDLYLLPSRQGGDTFLLLHYALQGATGSLLRLVKLRTQTLGHLPLGTDQDAKMEENYELNLAISNMTTFLLRRKQYIGSIEDGIKALRAKRLDSTISLEMSNGKIGTINIDTLLRSPTQVAEHVRDLITSIRVPLAHSQIVRVARLYVGNLLYNSSLLPVFHSKNAKTPSSGSTIKGNIAARILKAQQLTARQKYTAGHTAGCVEEKLNGAVCVNDMKVAYINNVSWSHFYDSLYMPSRDSSIGGNLLLQGDASAAYVKAEIFNGMKAANLFNLRSPQNVTSNITSNAAYVSNFQPGSVNGITFSNRPAFRGYHYRGKSFIDAGDQCAPDSRKPHFLCVESKYHDRVALKGSLTIDKLKLLNKNNESSLLVNGSSVSANILTEKYLLQATTQAFSLAVGFDKASISLSSLHASSLNNKSMKSHVLKCKLNMGPPTSTSIIFLNAQVDGNIYCNHSESKLRYISEIAVHHGDQALISGMKFFEMHMATAELNATHLNEVVSADIVRNVQPIDVINFTTSQQLSKIIVYQKLIVEEELASKCIFNLEHLTVPHILHVTNIIPESLNGFPVGNLFGAAFVTYAQPQLAAVKSLLIKGNIIFHKNLEARAILGIYWHEYEKNLIELNETSRISGKKFFLRATTAVNNLDVTTINDLDWGLVIKNLLLYSAPQVVTGNFAFEMLSAGDVIVPSVNDADIRNFIDFRSKAITIESDVNARNLEINGNTICLRPQIMPFDSVRNQLRILQNRYWRNLLVFGDIQWDRIAAGASANTQVLEYLYDNAVTTIRPNIATGDIVLTSGTVSTVVTNLNFFGSVNFTFLAQEILRKQSLDVQSVLSEIIFSDRLKFKRLVIQDHAHVQIFNNADILQLNSSLYRTSVAWPMISSMALAFSKPPLFNDISVTGRVNGMQPSFFYIFGESDLPALSIGESTIDGILKIDYTNEMAISSLLSNSITLRGGSLEVFAPVTFDHLKLESLALVLNINNLVVDNLVFRKNKCHKQPTIMGLKCIRGKLLLSGLTHVENLSLKPRRLQTPWTYIDIYKNRSVLWVSPSSHIKIEKSFNFTVDHRSICEPRVLQILVSREHIYLLYATASQILTKVSKNYLVEIAIFCAPKSRKCFSTVTISTRLLSKRLRLTKLVKDLELLELDAKAMFIMLHVTDRAETKYEIKVMRLQLINSTTYTLEPNWQIITVGIAKNVRLATIEDQIFVLSNGSIANKRVGAIFTLNRLLQRFILTSAIEGPFDSIAAVRAGSHTYHLVLGCAQCDIIQIYTFNQHSTDNSTQFELLQVLKMDAGLEAVVGFRTQDDHESDYLFVLTKNVNEYYHVFRYSYIGGWVPIPHGNQRRSNSPLVPGQTRIIVPLLEYRSFLLCAGQRCEMLQLIIPST